MHWAPFSLSCSVGGSIRIKLARTSSYRHTGCDLMNLMKCRVQDLRDLDFRDSLDYRFKHFQYVLVGAAVVRFGALFAVPETDRKHVTRAGHGKGDFVLEARLLVKQRNNFLLEYLCEFGDRVWLEMNGDLACKHDQPPGRGGAEMRGLRWSVLVQRT